MKIYDNLECIEKFKKSAIKLNKDAIWTPETNGLFYAIKRNNISDNTITVFVYNVWSFSKHADDIVSDDRIANNDNIGFTETQINSSDSTCKIMETLNFFNINFGNDENKCFRLAYTCRNKVAILDKFDTNRASIFIFKKLHFFDRVFTLMLVYRK